MLPGELTSFGAYTLHCFPGWGPRNGIFAN